MTGSTPGVFSTPPDLVKCGPIPRRHSLTDMPDPFDPNVPLSTILTAHDPLCECDISEQLRNRLDAYPGTAGTS
ncbi:hypothetical protein [[Mycobacterium] vasticus]|uniref:Uncharacterized protein n=1 Tax=[Mycobacterium] vasticus TaxID=2875777 RepID=A0ABU5YY19_9MYCO|nr:hypothetical protein [Mycolicibacter sp. MYC017]MEB3070043.1 hypothetical protein [Mycolicibacter sp. MYC017]